MQILLQRLKGIFLCDLDVLVRRRGIVGSQILSSAYHFQCFKSNCYQNIQEGLFCVVLFHSNWDMVVDVVY